MYSEHAQKKELDVADVRLAIQNRMDHCTTSKRCEGFTCIVYTAILFVESLVLRLLACCAVGVAGQNLFKSFFPTNK